MTHTYYDIATHTFTNTPTRYTTCVPEGTQLIATLPTSFEDTTLLSFDCFDVAYTVHEVQPPVFVQGRSPELAGIAHNLMIQYNAIKSVEWPKDQHPRFKKSHKGGKRK